MKYMLKNRLWVLCLLLPVLVLSACQTKEKEEVSLKENAAATAKEANFRTTTVERGDYIVENRASATLYYPIMTELSWDQEECRYQEILVANGDHVKKGDPLIRVSSEESTLPLEEKDKAIELLNEEFAAGKQQREEDISQMEKELRKQSSYAYVRMKKQIEFKKVQLEEYCFEMEVSLADLQKDRDKIVEAMEKTELIAPYDGVISEVPFAEPGQKVQVGQTLIRMYDPSTIVVGSENPNGAFAFGQRVTVNTRDHSYEGQVVAAAGVLPFKYQETHMVIKLDGDGIVDLKPGGSLFVTGDTITVKNVLIAGKAAFTLDGGKYYVQILDEDGSVHRRPVQLGSTNNNGNGTVVWIVDGLEEGDKLVISK